MNTKNGIAVSNVHVRNPKAVAIVNRRALRDHIPAATAASLIILDSQNQRGNSNRRSPSGQAENKPNFLEGVVEK